MAYRLIGYRNGCGGFSILDRVQDQMDGNFFDGGFDPHHINSSSGPNYDTWTPF